MSDNFKRVNQITRALIITNDILEKLEGATGIYLPPINGSHGDMHLLFPQDQVFSLTIDDKDLSFKMVVHESEETWVILKFEDKELDEDNLLRISDVSGIDVEFRLETECISN